MYKERAALRDLVVVGVFAALVFLLVSYFDLFERFASLSERRERWQLDEFFSLAAILAFALAVFSYRRWREGRREIAGRAWVEEALRESEERFKSLVQNSSDIVAVIGADGVSRYVSPSIERILGHGVQDRVGSSAFDLVHEEDRERLRGLMSDLLARPLGATMTTGFRVYHADGSVRYVEAVGTNLIGDPSVGGIVINYRDITARRRVEEALEESEGRYRAVVEQSSDATWLFDPETKRVLESNAAFQGLLGYTAEELGRMTNYDFVAHSDEDVDRTVARKTQNGTIPPRERRYRRKDGTIIDVEVGGTLISYRGKEVVCSVARDLTERRAADRALRESEERFRTAFEDAPVGVALTDLDRRYLRANRALCEMLGRPEEELLTKTSAELTHPGDLEASAARARRVLEGGAGSQIIEKRYVRADGQVVWALSSVSLVRDVEGNPSHFVALYQDITDRKEAEARMREAEVRYRSLVETIPAVTYVDELDGISTSTYISPQLVSVLGFTAEERLSEPGLWERRLHPEDRGRVLAANDRSNATGEPFDLEYRMVRKDGSVVWVWDASVVVRDAEGRLSYRQGVMFDITERKRTEGALAASETRLRTVIEQSPLGIHIFAPDGTSLLANGAWDRLWCMGDEEWTEGTNIFADEQLRATGLVPYIERSLADGEAVSSPPLLFDPANAGREGSSCWLRGLVYPVKDADGGILEVALLIEDVTERKEAEEKLKAAEQRYRTLVEQVPAVVYVDNADPENSAVFRSAHVEEVLGYEPQEFLKDEEFWQRLLHPEDRERVLEENERTNQTGEPFRIEYRMIRKDGRVVWLRDEAVLVRGEGGEPLYWHGYFADITERRRSEERLREAEVKYRTLVEQMPVVTYVQEIESEDAQYVSPQVEAMTGYRPEEFYADRDLWYAVVHPGDREDVRAEDGRTDRTGAPFEKEYRLVHRDGRTKWVRDEALLVRDTQGRPSLWQGVMLDITDRKRAEERIMFQAQLLEQVQAAVIATDLQGTVIHWNEHAERMYGWTREEALGRRAGDLMVGPLEARIAGEIMEELRAGGSWEGEFTVRRKDGSTFPVYVTDSPVQDAEGRAVGVVGVSTDITERKRAERELRLRDRAIEATPNGVVITDPNADDNPMVYVNPAFERMSGYGAGELIGLNCRMMQGSDRDQPELDNLRAALSGGREYRGVLRNYRKDGSMFFNELHIAPVLDGGGRVSNFVGIMSDVTERERAEEEMREANRRLTELASLRADFTAMVAHELDTPLAVIRGYADVLATGELEPPDRGRALDRIQSETEVLNALVEDVRVAAVVEREDFIVRPEWVPVGELLEAAARFARTLPGDHPLIVEEGVGGESEAWADAYRIGQVLRNLLSNAAKYSPEGTPIVLRAGAGEGAGRVRIEVADRGPGIHPDDAGRIFEKFGRGRDGRKQTGLGLGLYLSRRIVRSHGGELTLDPAPGDGGSVFGFDLEVADE